MKKRMLALLLALCCVSSLAGCGNQGQAQQDQSSQGQQNQGSQSTTTNPADEFLKGITPETAEANGVCGADLTWYYQDNVLVIKGTGEMTDYGENDPPWEDYKEDIGWIIIGDGCTSVGKAAFAGFSSLSKVDFPDTLKVIKDYVFERCNNLKELTLPTSLEEISSGNFSFEPERFETLTFLGDAPDGLQFTIIDGSDALTVNYSGSGFEPYIEQYPNTNWIKQ